MKKNALNPNSGVTPKTFPHCSASHLPLLGKLVVLVCTAAQVTLSVITTVEAVILSTNILLIWQTDLRI